MAARNRHPRYGGHELINICLRMGAFTPYRTVTGFSAFGRPPWPV